MSIVLGAWLLTAWDLVLDPAMASDKMTVMHFWSGRSTAPISHAAAELGGVARHGLTFIAVGRASWRGRFDAAALNAWLPFGVYAVNVGWAMALSLSVGLWPTALAAIGLSLLPAALALRAERRPEPLAA